MATITNENPTKNLLIDTEHEFKLPEEISLIEVAIKKQTEIREKIFSKEGYKSARTIGDQLDKAHKVELNALESGEVIQIMHNPPADSTVQIMGEHNHSDDDLLTQQWQRGLQFSEQLREAARSGGQTVSEGAEANLTNLALSMGLINEDFQPRINISSLQSPNLYCMFSENFNEFLAGQLKAILGFKDTYIPVGLIRQESRWIWVTSNDVTPSYSPYEDILQNPEEWLSRSPEKTNEGRMHSIRYLHSLRCELEAGNKTLLTILNHPLKIAKDIENGFALPERLMTLGEYDRLCRMIEMLPNGDQAAIIPWSNQLYTKAQNPSKVEIYRKPNNLDSQIYWDSTEFPVQILSPNGRPIGVTTGKKTMESMRSSGTYGGFLILNDIVSWHQSGMLLQSI